MLLIFDYMNTLYPSATQAGFDSMTVPALAAAAKATATALKGTGVSYEVWNEENGGDFNVDGGVAEYAALSAAVIAAVHEADPSALVTTGGLGTPPLGTLDDAFLKAMLAAGAGAGANAIGIHPYRQGGAESVTDDLALANATVAEALPSAPPIWDTEWGYSSEWYGDAGGATPASRELQAQRVSRELLTVWAVGFPVAMYYDTRDDGTDATDQEDNFGLLLPDSTAKPAMVAVQTLTRLAKGRTFAGFLNMGFTSMHAMLLTGSSDRLVALWSDAPGSVTQVAVPATAAVTDFLGNAVAVTADGGATNVTVSEVAGPLFLTFPNPPPATTDAGVDASIRDASLDLDASRDAAHDAMPAEFLPASSKSGCGCKVAGAPERDRSWFALASFALIGLAARIRGRDVGVDAGPGGGRPPWAR
jgi:hypothetical protein